MSIGPTNLSRVRQGFFAAEGLLVIFSERDISS